MDAHVRPATCLKGASTTRATGKQVAQIVPASTSSSSVRYVLQDANYNMVGIARFCDSSIIELHALVNSRACSADNQGESVGLQVVVPKI